MRENERQKRWEDRETRKRPGVKETRERERKRLRGKGSIKSEE